MESPKLILQGDDFFSIIGMDFNCQLIVIGQFVNGITYWVGYALPLLPFVQEMGW